MGAVGARQPSGHPGRRSGELPQLRFDRRTRRLRGPIQDSEAILAARAPFCRAVNACAASCAACAALFDEDSLAAQEHRTSVRQESRTVSRRVGLDEGDLGAWAGAWALMLWWREVGRWRRT